MSLGRAEERSPSALITIPQEWGVKGVEAANDEHRREDAWRWAQPTLPLASRYQYQ